MVAVSGAAALCFVTNKVRWSTNRGQVPQDKFQNKNIHVRPNTKFNGFADVCKCVFSLLSCTSNPQSPPSQTANFVRTGRYVISLYKYLQCCPGGGEGNISLCPFKNLLSSVSWFLKSEKKSLLIDRFGCLCKQASALKNGRAVDRWTMEK